MTREEAVDLVLRGGHWRKCGACAGRGLVPAEPGISIIADPTAESRTKCPWCKGAGYWLPFVSKMAHELLGLELPAKPLTGREMMAQAGGEYIKSRLLESMPRYPAPVLVGTPLTASGDDKTIVSVSVATAIRDEDTDETPRT